MVIVVLPRVHVLVSNGKNIPRAKTPLTVARAPKKSKEVKWELEQKERKKERRKDTSAVR